MRRIEKNLTRTIRTNGTTTIVMKRTEKCMTRIERRMT